MKKNIFPLFVFCILLYGKSVQSQVIYTKVDVSHSIVFEPEIVDIGTASDCGNITFMLISSNAISAVPTEGIGEINCKTTTQGANSITVVTALDVNTYIGSSMTWLGGDAPYNCSTTGTINRTMSLGGTSYDSDINPWKGVSEKYVAMRFKMLPTDTKWKYGWAKISVAADSKSFTFHEWAYSNDDDEPIKAGQMPFISSNGTIDHVNKTIKFVVGNIPALSDFKNAITLPNAAESFQIYQPDGTTVANDLQNNYKLKITGKDGITTLVYMVDLNPNISIKQNNVYFPHSNTYDFGKVTLNQTKEVVFTIENTGVSDLIISNNTFSGKGFGLKAPIPATITSNSIASFTVTFTPNTVTSYLSSLTIQNNDPDEPNYKIYFKGAGESNTSVNYISSYDKVKIYPNPAVNILNIENLPSKNNIIEIDDLSGKLIYKAIIYKNNLALDISKYNKGTYVLRINNKIFKKFIKK